MPIREDLKLEHLTKIQASALRYAAGAPDGSPPRRVTTWRSLLDAELVKFRLPTTDRLGGYEATEAGRILLEGATRPQSSPKGCANSGLAWPFHPGPLTDNDRLVGCARCGQPLADDNCPDVCACNTAP